VTDRATGESQAGAPPSAGSFGDAAAEMANETEVEEPVAPRAPYDDETDVRDDADEVTAEEQAALADTEESTEVDELLVAQTALAERTADLQRLQAEYLNYKRRVDRDRELVRENATFAALAPIVDVLDTIDRARGHGDLDEGFQAVADQLERVVASAGLVKYGEVGDPFDPRLHEALSHIGEDPDVEVTTCKVIAKAGYRIGDRVVRAAQVLVVDPAGS
jgi:molecular chaperone GrpE